MRRTPENFETIFKKDKPRYLKLPRKPLTVVKPTTADSNIIPRRRIVKKSEKKQRSSLEPPKKKGFLESGGHLNIRKYSLEPFEDNDKFLSVSQ